jgi:metallophosphoesterase superfamily enzyme
MKLALIADIHLIASNPIEQWVHHYIEWAKWLKEELIKNKIDNIAILGDIFHNRDEINVSVLDLSSVIFNDILKDFHIEMITGNHDCYLKSESSINSISIFKNNNHIVVYEELTKRDNLLFVPWRIS